MRKITYFHAGTVADFNIPEERFREFSKAIGLGRAHSEDEILKAREVLGVFVAAADDSPAGPEQILAACFIWNYFNSHPLDDRHIEGDIVIVDLDGDGVNIDYAAAADISIAPAD